MPICLIAGFAIPPLPAGNPAGIATWHPAWRFGAGLGGSDVPPRPKEPGEGSDKGGRAAGTKRAPFHEAPSPKAEGAAGLTPGDVPVKVL